MIISVVYKHDIINSLKYMEEKIMSELNKKLNQALESYNPTKPEILSMMELLQHEKNVDIFQLNGAVFEVVERPETIWVGTLSYADNNYDEPDMGALLSRYQNLVPTPKEDRINPDWDAAISINYGRHGEAPKGMMFGQETYSAEKQDKQYDLFTQPGGMYIRIANNQQAAALLGKESCQTWELFGYIKEKAAPQNGYRIREDVDIAIEYHNYKNNSWYAYIPVEIV